MLLISNHLLNKIPIPDDAIIRINIAWINMVADLQKALDIKYDVFIDYPEGRTKPPAPKIPYTNILTVAKLHKNIKYIAVSNIESGNIAYLFKKSMPDSIQFVPKIETALGVNNIDSILQQAIPQYIMLDTEDLFANVNRNVDKFKLLTDQLTQKCFKYHTKILTISGVVFSD